MDTPHARSVVLQKREAQWMKVLLITLFNAKDRIEDRELIIIRL